MMKILGFIILLNVIAVCNVYGADKIGDPEPIPNSTDIPTSTTDAPTPPTTLPTTAKPTPTTSTTKPTTTTIKPPKTTSVTPNVTTTSPTTVSPTTPTTPPTTTVSPSPNTTAAPITTTPAPAPKDVPWEVKNNNYTCIILTMRAIIELNFANNGSKNEEGSQIDIPKNATASGACDKDKQWITLTWTNNNTISNISLVFTNDKSKFVLDNVTVVLDTRNIPNPIDNETLVLIHKTKEYSTPDTMSYLCAKPPALNLNTTTEPIKKVATITFFDLRVQAFANITNSKFAEGKDCEPYETPDIVPIAVGCALMALIIMVLIGYLIGRRRNQARGYLSMVEE